MRLDIGLQQPSTLKPAASGSFKQRSKMEQEDGEFLNMGLSHNLQDTCWNVTVSTSLWKDLSSTCRVGAQRILGHQEAESQHEGCKRKKIATTK